MNDNFNFRRFLTYFKYDITQMWRNHSRAAILIGGAGAFFYILWVMFSLVFTQQWQTPTLPARFAMFLFAFAVLELYQVRTYGHLTDKKAGSSWLMIPASKTEKFVSMLLVSLVVVPLLFLTVYAVLDGFLSLVDPTYGKALFTSFLGTYSDVLDAFANMRGTYAIHLSPATIIITTLAGFFCNFMYFLLCGICFKRNKLVCAFAIMFAFSTVLSLIMGFIMPGMLSNLNGVDVSEEMVLGWTQGIINFSVILSILMTIGFGWGIWYRIKTLQH